MKYYYLSKPKLINEEIQVLKTSGFSLSDENADALFGIGNWVCYFGPKLPARMKYDTTTNKIVVLTDDAPKQHLYAGVSLLKGVVTEDKFDPSMFVNTNDLNFLIPLKFGGTPAYTYPHKSYFMTFKADGTPVSELMRVLNDTYIQLTPSNIDALVKRHLRVEGNSYTNGVVTGVSDVIAGQGSSAASLKNIKRKAEVLFRDVFNEINKIKQIIAAYAVTNNDVGVIAAFLNGGLPPGWVPCDGRFIPKDDSTKLFYDRYPNGRVPDLRNEFLRGWGSTSLGTRQTDAGRNITGRFLIDGQDNLFTTTATGCFEVRAPKMAYDADSRRDYYNPLERGSFMHIDASRVWGSAHIADEFRPRNITVLWAMKVYFSHMAISTNTPSISL